ncbi:hypothetical protein [Streptomyces sp. NPDC101455]|uniref:hypothetical protein n=1 Tax=Streptomyces sp. NPDC101455 TaxID=3366142 RepID=UPI0037FAC093
MKLLSRKSITAATAIAILGGLSIAAVPSQAASPVHNEAAVQDSSATPTPTLTPRLLAKLPLTDRHLTKHEKANLAIVLRDYYVAEGSHIDVPRSSTASPRTASSTTWSPARPTGVRRSAACCST